MNGNLIYSALEGGQWFLVDNGLEGQRYDIISELLFSLKDQKWLMVIDGNEYGLCRKPEKETICS